MAETALVTGADGFLGSHVVESFVRQGFSVKAMAMYNSVGTAGWLDSLHAEILTEVSIHWVISETLVKSESWLMAPM